MPSSTPTSPPPLPAAPPRAVMLWALLAGLTVFSGLVLFAVYILNQKPKFVPPLVFTDAAGKVVKLQDSLGRDKPVLLHFWATWCAPCREELPSLVQAVNEGGSGLVFLPVAVDAGGKGPVEAYLQAEKITLPLFFDPDAVEAQKIGTQTFPETWLISPEGKILARWEGAIPWTGQMLAQKARKAATL